MQTTPFEEKVFRDPVHKYVYVQHPLIWRLIDAPEVQRLRRIRQLGTGYLTFHGAEHSRFTHALGAYELTRQLLSRFRQYIDVHWDAADDLVCLCAALLHDVGHGPFSHSIESVFSEHHEQRSMQIIMGDTHVCRVLREVDERFPEAVASVLAQKHPKTVVTALIASQLDADRMDYLLRDAYMTGVSYGQFDIERMLRVIRPYRGQIVVKSSGKHAVEHYLLARYQMHWQVYFHPVTRSAELVLRSIFMRAKHIWQSGYCFQFLPAALNSLFCDSLSTEQFLWLDDAVILATFAQWRDERDSILADLCRRFLDRRLLAYVWIEEEADASLVLESFRTRAQAQGFDPIYYVHLDAPIDWSYAMADEQQVCGGTPIYLLTEDERLEEMSAQSAIVRSILGEQRGKRRIYYPH